MARREPIIAAPQRRTANRRPIASLASLRRRALFESQPARVGDVEGRRRSAPARRQPVARQKLATAGRRALAARLAPLRPRRLFESEPAYHLSQRHRPAGAGGRNSLSVPI